MSILRVILPDQISESISSLDGSTDRDKVLICEIIENINYVHHHPKKIAFLFSAMRHFAEELSKKGLRISYVKFDDEHNTSNLTEELKKAITKFKPERVVITEPSEYHILTISKEWHKIFNLPVEIRPDTRFLASKFEFAKWADGKKQLRMEFFYREMRKKYNLLIEPDGKPTGGIWNYDKENRRPPKAKMTFPKRISHKKSKITYEVLKLVQSKFSHHFGKLEPFYFSVTRDEALIELKHFIDELLPQFGDYQDAMVAGEAYLYHSLLSSYINAGLLLPLEICNKAEAAYRKGKAPINSVEGFIRQIIGWREYIRGIYWLFMPKYAELNSLNAIRPLPEFYWTANTGMFCIAEVVRHTRDHAYSHHIQRLMITGNFALLSGLDVKEVQNWYLAVYADAYEWVEMPNTLGMTLFGDGGIVASKPYAASGKYIDCMSNYCQNCKYNPNLTIGENACPFNALYWDFLIRNEDKFRGNQRMPYIYASWDKFEPEKKEAILNQANKTLQKMQEGNL